MSSSCKLPIVYMCSRQSCCNNNQAYVLGHPVETYLTPQRLQQTESKLKRRTILDWASGTSLSQTNELRVVRCLMDERCIAAFIAYHTLINKWHMPYSKISDEQLGRDDIGKPSCDVVCLPLRAFMFFASLLKLNATHLCIFSY